MHQHYYKKSKEDLLKEFKTSKKGLSDKKAKIRLEEDGKNIIKKTNRINSFKILFEQFNSFLIYILIISSIILLLINKIVDAIVIFAIVLFNSGVGFFQQYKAEKAIITLKKMIVSKTKVMRGGILRIIKSAEIVPGDIILLEQGDKINADCRIIEEENLQTNEASLTGESLPIDKFSNKIEKDASLAKQNNMIFMGTQVVKGSCKALVVNTGKNTIFGNIAETLQEMEVQKTPMQKRLDRFSKQLGFIILGMVIFILILGIIQNLDFFEIFLTAVALAISAIPEGLPAVLAISFAISSVLLSKNNVIIRKFPAVETLGSVTVICSDKTGTITQEKMSVQKIFTNNTFYTKKEKLILLKNKKIDIKKNKELQRLLKTSVLCNNSRFEIIEGQFNFLGDPTENTLLENALDLNLNKKLLIEKEPSLKRFEFDSERKMMSIARDSGANLTLYSKGATEKIIEKSGFELIGNNIQKLDEKRKKELIEKSREMEKEALRVIAFAYKIFNKKSSPQEQSLIFLGFIGMIDPPRKEVKDAVEHCKKAGIKIKIITGDSAVTATAIAKQVGITGKTITGNELEKMSDENLIQNIEDIAIFARTTPQQKLRITKILQQKGEVVAITGDGINDVLALKSADIGIAMGQRGTDIARDVSDIVLIDDNFASIVQGIKQGRKTYDNIKKFTKYMLSVNFSGIFLITFSMIMAFLFGPEKWFLPLLPLQILWINLVTDSFPALTLALEKDEKVLASKPRKEKSLFNGIWKFVIIAGLFALAVQISTYIIGITGNFEPSHTRTIILTTVVLFEIFFVYTCRSDKIVLGKKFFSNKWLNYAVLFSLFAHLILLYTPLAKIFDVIPLSFGDWLIIIPFSISGLIFFEIGKLFIKKSHKS